MRPIDSETSKPWPDELCQAKLRSIRADVCEELVERDRSRGIPADGTVYRADPATQTMTIDPELARRKHTGDEATALIKLRWAEFCIEPRPLQEFAVHERTSTRRRVLEEAREAAAKYNGNGNGSRLLSPEELASGVVKDGMPPDPVGFPCQQCSKVCGTATGLGLHMKTHRADRIPGNG